MASASAPFERNIIIEDLIGIKVTIPLRVMTFNPANCFWEELSIESVATLLGKVCENQHQSYISTKDWMDGSAFFAYCNNNNQIKTK